jgi:mannose-6-phosphate isomerase-like protein (cupin superfamily)
MADNIIGFENHLEDIRNKRHWWTKIDFNMDWNAMMSLVDNHPESKYNWVSEKKRLGLNEFHRRGSAPKFAKDIFEEMYNLFVRNAPQKEKYEKGKAQITNIAFCGFGKYTGSYPRHKDGMDVFLVQVLGDCPIRVGYTEERTEQDEDRVMKPGDCLWIPRGTYHQLTPKESRVTFSFGFESDVDIDPALFL